MVSRQDEVLAHKANKMSLLEVEKRCSDKYLKKEDADAKNETFQ